MPGHSTGIPSKLKKSSNDNEIADDVFLLVITKGKGVRVRNIEGQNVLAVILCSAYVFHAVESGRRSMLMRAVNSWW